MTAVDDFLVLKKSFKGYLPYMQAAFAQLQAGIASLVGGSLTNGLVFGARQISSAVDIQLLFSDALTQSVTMTATAKAVILPNATTGVVEGLPWTIHNAGTNAFALKAFGGSTLIAVVAAGAVVNVVLVNDGTSAGVWVIGAANVETFTVAASDEVTPLSAGTAKLTFRMPFGFTLADIRASLTVAQASGSILTVDVNEGGATILTTKLTIDNGEKTTANGAAAIAAVIGGAGPGLADDAEITIDIDQIGDGTAKGLKLTFIGYRT